MKQTELVHALKKSTITMLFFRSSAKPIVSITYKSGSSITDSIAFYTLSLSKVGRFFFSFTNTESLIRLSTAA